MHEFDHLFCESLMKLTKNVINPGMIHNNAVSTTRVAFNFQD